VPISAQHLFFNFFERPGLKFGLDQIRSGPPSRLIILPLHAEYLLHVIAIRTRRKNEAEVEGGKGRREGEAYLEWKELAAWLVAHGVSGGGEAGS
jgi:hypothetical protein